MRVLVLSAKYIWPLTGGGEIRNFNLLREASRHHEVVLLCFLQRPELRDLFPALQPYCRKIIGLDLPRPKWRKAINAAHSAVSSHPFMLLECKRAAMAAAIQRTIAEERIDVIHGHAIHMAQYAHLKGDAAFVYDPHNLDHVLWQRFAEVQTNPITRAYFRGQIDKFVRWEQRIADLSEKIVTLSDTDRDEYQRIAPNADIMTVPNGADTEYFQPQPNATEPCSIVYTAQFGWPPQDDAALYFYREIFPIVRQRCPEAKLYFVGKTPPEAIRRLASENVIVTGFVEDIRDYVGRATVVVMPLRVGAGTKHRIYQALSMGKAVVATNIGAEGIELRHGETALIADDPKEFAGHVVHVLTDSALRERLGVNGRKFIVENYDWRANYAKLDQAFQEAVAKTKRPTPAHV